MKKNLNIRKKVRNLHFDLSMIFCSFELKIRILNSILCQGFVR
jgi:hypothetical protein